MKPIVIKALFVAALFAFPSTTLAGVQSSPELRGDGRLSIYNYHGNSYSQIKTLEVAAITDAFKSRDGKTHAIDVRLIDLIDYIEDSLGAETIELISCYRSPSYNRKLRLEGRTVARESLHMEGKACDIHIDEFDEKDVFDFVKSLKAGGVGYYPQYSFVHIDTGLPRTWEEKPANGRVLVGTENNPNISWSAITDSNTYRRSDKMTIGMTNNGYDKMRPSTGHVWLEHFKKGEWAEHWKIKVDGGSKKLNVGETLSVTWSVDDKTPYGKYRLVIFPNRKSDPFYSNEFYVKKDMPNK